jgi:predicted nucleic acid-binding protein
MLGPFPLVSIERAHRGSLQLESADYEEAAAAFSRCRERGIQGSNTDSLICATAIRRNLAIYSTDEDFRRYAKVLKLELH